MSKTGITPLHPMTLRIKLRKINYLNCIDEAIIFVFLITNAYVRIVENNSAMLLVSAACLSIAGAYNLIKATVHNEHKIVLVSGLFVFFWIIEILARPTWQYEFKYLVSSLCYIGVAYSFCSNKRIIAPYKALYYGVCLFLIIQLRVFRVHYSEIMKEGSSYNYISVVVLFYLLLLNFVQIENGKELEFIPGLLFLIVCIFSYGRGGIVTALIYCGSVFFAKAYYYRTKKEMYAAGLGLVIATIFMMRRHLSSLTRSGLLNKFFLYGFDSNGRMGIWAQFLSTCKRSFGDFILGGDPRTLEYADYNMHNSYLQLYASLGLFLTVFLVAFFMKRITGYIHNREAWMLVIAVSFIARSMTDKIMFRGYNEIIFYILLFYGSTMRKNVPLEEPAQKDIRKGTIQGWDGV